MYLGRNCIRASSESAHQSAKCWNTYAEVSRCSRTPCRKSKRNDAFAIGSLSGIPSWRFQRSTVDNRAVCTNRARNRESVRRAEFEKCLFPSDIVYVPLSRAVSLCFSRVLHRVPARWHGRGENVARCRRSRDPRAGKGSRTRAPAIITENGEIAGRGCASGKCNSVTRPAGKPRERALNRFTGLMRIRGAAANTERIHRAARSFFIDPVPRSIRPDADADADAEKSARFYGILGELKILRVFALLAAPGNMRAR
jgi:hypothetical protein